MVQFMSMSFIFLVFAAPGWAIRLDEPELVEVEADAATTTKPAGNGSKEPAPEVPTEAPKELPETVVIEAPVPVTAAPDREDICENLQKAGIASYDTDKDGSLCPEEFRILTKDINPNAEEGVSDEDTDKLAAKWDFDSSGNINMKEAMAYCKGDLSGASHETEDEEGETNSQCSGWAPQAGVWRGKGASCARWGWQIEWCYVNQEYKGEGKIQSDTYPGKYMAPCANMATLTTSSPPPVLLRQKEVDEVKQAAQQVAKIAVKQAEQKADLEKALKESVEVAEEDSATQTKSPNEALETAASKVADVAIAMSKTVEAQELKMNKDPDPVGAKVSLIVLNMDFSVLSQDVERLAKFKAGLKKVFVDACGLESDYIKLMLAAGSIAVQASCFPPPKKIKPLLLIDKLTASSEAVMEAVIQMANGFESIKVVSSGAITAGGYAVDGLFEADIEGKHSQDAFDCSQGLENFESTWTDDKKDWCCVNNQLACQVRTTTSTTIQDFLLNASTTTMTTTSEALDITDMPTPEPTRATTETTTDASTTSSPTTTTTTTTTAPTAAPTCAPTPTPTPIPTEVPTAFPTVPLSAVPTQTPTPLPTDAPTEVPTALPTLVPTPVPTAVPTMAVSNTTTPTPTVAQATPPPTVEGPILCADEHQVCVCSGTVYFGLKFLQGKPGHGKIRSFTQTKKHSSHINGVLDRIDCSAAAFEDPGPDYYKHCYCEEDAVMVQSQQQHHQQKHHQQKHHQQKHQQQKHHQQKHHQQKRRQQVQDDAYSLLGSQEAKDDDDKDNAEIDSAFADLSEE